MSQASVPILYSFRRCPYAMRARMAVLVGGAPVEIREVLLRDKPAALVAASAKATVPVLVTAEAVLEESLDIMRWVLAKADPEGWLARDDAALVAACDGAFKHSLDGYKYGAAGAAGALAHRAAGAAFLETLEARLASTANLCGAARGFADIAIMPFVRQFAAVDPGWFGGLPLPHAQRWLAGHVASPLFAAAMIRLARWQPGDRPVQFPG